MIIIIIIIIVSLNSYSYRVLVETPIIGGSLGDNIIKGVLHPELPYILFFFKYQDIFTI